MQLAEFLGDITLLNKRSTLKQRIAPKGSNFFTLRVNPFSNGIQNDSDRECMPSVYDADEKGPYVICGQRRP